MLFVIRKMFSFDDYLELQLNRALGIKKILHKRNYGPYSTFGVRNIFPKRLKKRKFILPKQYLSGQVDGISSRQYTV